LIVDLYEYQAVQLLARHGLPVSPGELATSPEQAAAVARRLGPPVVVKAQVKVGGRGKAGGVKLAASAAQARDRAGAILGAPIKGHVVRSVWLTPAAEIEREFYVSILLDRAERSYLALASAEGGMEIEQLAAERPTALVRRVIDPSRGLDAATAGEIVTAAGFPSAAAPAVADVLERLWAVFSQEDATLVEVNPLVWTSRGEILALDAKISLDDNAAFRQPENFAAFADTSQTDPLELAAQAKNLHYVKLDGTVGVIGNGAGLVMSTLDAVARAGRDHGGIRPANFLDIGGGASAQIMTDGLSIVLSDPQVQAVLVNVFGGITACDQVAQGIVSALNDLGDRATKPLVVRLDGTAVTAGRAILGQAGHPLVHLAETMDGAADDVVRLVISPDTAPAPEPPMAGSGQVSASPTAAQAQPKQS
jgi:succinyl-CoA synthetase beta subunit